MRTSTSSSMDCFILPLKSPHQDPKPCFETKWQKREKSHKKKKKKKKKKPYFLISPNVIASTSSAFSGPTRSLSFVLMKSSVECVRPQSGWNCTHALGSAFLRWKFPIVVVGRVLFQGNLQEKRCGRSGDAEGGGGGGMADPCGAPQSQYPLPQWRRGSKRSSRHQH